MNEAPELKDKTQKPVMIILISIYTFILGLISLLAGIPSFFGHEFTLLSSVIAFFLIIIGILALIASHGLWALQTSGYTMALAIYLMAIPLGIGIIVFDTSTATVFLQLLSIFIAMWILFYLFSPEIRAIYRIGWSPFDDESEYKSET
jgi:hypothetical protein